MPPVKKNELKTKAVYVQPEKKDWRVIIVFWLFVVISIAGIAWMVIKSPRQGQLVCRSVGQASLTGFGDCVEEKP